MGFDTTFSAVDVDTNRIDRIIDANDDEINNMKILKVISSDHKQMEADQADEVQITQDEAEKNSNYQPELLNIKMIDR